MTSAAAPGEDAEDDTAAASERRTGWLVVVLSGGMFVVLAVVLIPWDWLPGADLATVRPDEVFTDGQIAGGEEYSSGQWLFSWINLAISLLVALWLGLTPLGARLVRRLPGRWWSQVALGTLALLLVSSLVTLPVSWLAHRRARDYGLSVQGTADWLRDRGVSLLVSWLFTAVALLVVIALARRLRRTWPAVAAAAAMVLAVLGSFVYPVLVEPLFSDFTTMSDGPLRSEIMALADREGVEVDDVLVADASRRTTTLNAYVSGFGGTRRVVVYDNLIEDLPRNEALVVVAHELAHAKHRDVLVGTTLGALGGAFGVGLLALLLSRGWLRRRSGADGLGDPAVVPLLLVLITLGSLLASPVENTMSRAVEARADRTSLSSTGNYDAFTEMQRQLALRSLADPAPPDWRQFWFGSHPTVLQRIGMAEALRRN